MMMEGLLFYLKQKKIEFISIAVTLPVIVLLMWRYDQTALNYTKEFIAGAGAFVQFYASLKPLIKALTDGVTVALIGLAIYIHGRLSKKDDLRQTGKLILAGFITAGISAQFIKHFVGRARPRVTDETVFIGPNFHINFDSFPSGHTAVAFAIAYILSAMYPRYTALFYAFAVLTAFDRLIGLSHFVSDIIASVVLGVLIGRFIVEKMHKQPNP